MENKRLEIPELVQKLREFAKERDWDQFHSPKNLTMALSVECSELMEHFQWLTGEQAWNLVEEGAENIEAREAIAEEVSDVLLYTLRLADVMNLNLADAVYKKLEKNAKKYPAKLVRGSAKKYSDYE